MLAGDADDQSKIGLDDAVFRLGDAAADFFQPAEIARAGKLRIDLAAGGHELELVEIQLEEQGPFAAARQQRGAVEILQISRQIAGNADSSARPSAGNSSCGYDLCDHIGGIGLMIERIVDEPDFSADELGQAFLDDGAGDGGFAAAGSRGDLADRFTAAIGANPIRALLGRNLGGGLLEYRGLGIGLIVVADYVGDRQRRAVDSPADPARDFAQAASAMAGQSAGAAEDVGPFRFVCLREIAGANDLIAMDGQESLDHAEHESDAFFAVLEDDPAGRQAAATPSLNCFAGDVESLGDIVDGHHGFGGERFV